MSDLIALKEIAKDLSALVVEDSITIQKQMQKFLEKLFGKVYVAKDGYEALEIYKEFKPNIILTDIQMPKMDGYELIQNLNTLNHTSKIIVFSAYGQAENVIKFLRMGVCDFIQKPVNFNQLTASLLKVTSGNICDEEKFEDELLNDLKIIKDSKLPIKLINHYKGLPLIHEGIIVSLKEDSLQIHTQKIQKKAILEEKSTTLETDKVILMLKLKDYDEENDILTFDNLEKIEHSPNKREVIRVAPNKDFSASIFFKNDRYAFSVSTISTKAISFEVKFFEEDIKVNDHINLTLGFNTFYSTSYHSMVSHKERVDTKGIVLKLDKLENNITKIVILLNLSIADKKILEKYIYQREIEIVKEFKRITQDME